MSAIYPWSRCEPQCPITILLLRDPIRMDTECLRGARLGANLEVFPHLERLSLIVESPKSTCSLVPL